MIAQSYIVGFLGKSAETVPNYDKKKAASNSYPNFIDTLNSTVNKNDYSKSTRKNADLKPGKEIGKKADKFSERDAKADASESDPKIKSYKGAVKENEQTSAKRNEKSTGNKNVAKNETIKNDEKETEKVEEKVIVESLAQILNISVDELKQIMSNLDISTNDLADESKTTQIASKISDLFGLDSEQEATLLKLAQFTVNETKTQETQLVQDKKADWVNFEGVEVVDKKVQLQDAEVLGNKIKEVLSQIKNKLETEPEKLFDDISNKIGDLKTIKLNTFDETQTIEDSEQETAEDNMVDKALKSNEESGTSENNEEDTSGNQKTDRINMGKTAAENSLESKVQGTDQLQFDNTLNNQQIKTNGASELSKVQNEVAVSKKEIISQIVEKAKAVLTDEKSEMVIDLKPDHLGKLSLKVITERGAVVAKFIAESEQVKAAIESNMDNLKESLTKQGFSIQDFSVSVGHESRKNLYEGYSSSQNNSRTGKGEKITSAATVGVSAMEDNQQKLNPYMVNNSSIDLTA